MIARKEDYWVLRISWGSEGETNIKESKLREKTTRLMKLDCEKSTGRFVREGDAEQNGRLRF